MSGKALVQGCSKCDDNNKNRCVECKPDWVFENGKCAATECLKPPEGNTDPNFNAHCLKCNPKYNWECQTCEDGYYNGGTGTDYQCYRNSCLGWDGNGSKTKVDGCYECFPDDRTKCAACNRFKSLYLDRNMCMEDCRSDVEGCLMCKDKSRYDCEICAPGWTLEYNDIYERTFCKSCKELTGDSNCGTCTMAGVCEACKEGSEMVGGKCVNTCGDPNCASCTGSVCNTCVKGYERFNMKCRPECEVATGDANCIECTGAVCHKCKPGLDKKPGKKCAKVETKLSRYNKRRREYDYRSSASVIVAPFAILVASLFL